MAAEPLNPQLIAAAKALEMQRRDIRLRCIEAAAKNIRTHPDGHAAGVLEDAAKYAAWVLSTPPAAKVEDLF